MSDKNAPHGYEDDGITPKTPYGLNLDGTPRKSNRGARPGQRGNGGSRGTKSPRAKVSNLTDAKRKEALCGLADMLIVTPMAGLSASPQIAARIGPAQTDALAGDAVIVSHFMPPFADALIVLSQSKPGALAWLDTVEDKAPYLMLMNVGAQVIKAITENHLRPSPQLAEAGRTMVQMKIAALAQAINEEAAAMGIPTNVPTPRESAEDAA